MANLSSTATLQCRLVSTNIVWMYTSLDAKPPVLLVDSCQTVNGADPRYQVDKSNGSCNLVISNLTFELSGTYTCQDVWGDMSGKAKLIVAMGK